MLKIGIDEAGRGPIIGSMAICGVLLDDSVEPKLKEAGVKDSKLLSQKERLALSQDIKSSIIDSKLILVSPSEIDLSLSTGTNLNTLDAIKVASIINSLNTNERRKEKIKVIADCPSPNINAWTSLLKKHLVFSDNLEISCEHKADFNHVSVSAASVLAKLAREEEIASLKKQFGEIGSGYASDPITQKFLEENISKHDDSGLFRKSWDTWKTHKAKQEQKNLLDF